VNFYKHHLGDYDGATMHLSWDEDLAYTRLLRVYYRDEKPIPIEPRQAYRLTRAQSKNQRQAIDDVLEEFFEKRSDGWHNKRADEEIHAAQAQKETNRRIAANRPRIVNGSHHESYNDSHHESLYDSSTVRDQLVHLPDSRLQTPDSTSQTPDIPTPTPPKGGGVRQRRSEFRAAGDRASEAWAEVVAQAGRTDDPLALHAMRAIGGYSRIRLRTTHEESQIRREFIDAYRQGNGHAER
jgi:uncharacterized protein YdaU (DUF1376 family)